jgi:hypothetical protein
LANFFHDTAPAILEFDDFRTIHAGVAILVIITLAMQRGRAAPSLLPSVDKINFPALMDIPPVYRDSPVPFSKCHLTKMCTPEFLAGEWTGFYSDHRSGNRVLDPPMQTIHIETSPIYGADADGNRNIRIAPSSRGHDAHGQFTLSGVVGVDGRVAMEKRYLVQTDWHWIWKGEVTPFGLAGIWGDRFTGIGGYFWIWKKEWCQS